MNAHPDVNHDDDEREFGRSYRLGGHSRFNAEDNKQFLADCQRAATRQRLRAWLFCSIAVQDFRPSSDNEWLWELAEMLFEEGAADMLAMKDAAEKLEEAAAARFRKAHGIDT